MATILLEDGTFLFGDSFGAEGDAVAEIVFNTSMTGYQEILTDPSYCGQAVLFTYPLIGNYGICVEENESLQPFVTALFVREYVDYVGQGNRYSLGQFLRENGIIGICALDTRMITRKIRKQGSMKCAFSTFDKTCDQLYSQLLLPLPRDQVARSSTKSIHISPNFGRRVVLLDCGSKHSIIRELSSRGCEVVSVPYNTSAADILRLRPSGVVLSNGPGDPKDLPEVVEMIKLLVGKVPIFGICLGHQLLALASGADTEKMKFGHRGGNHPVKELETDRVNITAQNHGFAVKASSLEGTDLVATHVAINDGSVAGLRHKHLPIFSVQFHPESAPGPRDSTYLFDQFFKMIVQEERVHA